MTAATSGDPVLLRRADYDVRMADVDAASVIYYASPLRWMEVLVGDWYRELGHSLRQQLTDGTNCPCVDVRVTYRRPIRLDDRLDLQLRVDRVGTTSFSLSMTASLPADAPGGEGAPDVAGELALEVHATYVSVVVGESGEVRSGPIAGWLLDGLGRV